MNDNGGLILANMIYLAIKNKRFISIIILGNRDIGKSTYALKVLHEVFLLLGYDKDTSWDLALSCIKFRIPDVTEYLNEGTDEYEQKRTKKPALIWDDLRKYASGMQYHEDRQLYKEVSGLLDTIKIPIHCFIGTCPSMKGVMGIIQDYDSYQINIKYHPDSSKGGNYRLAKGFLWVTSPMGQRALYPKFNDTFLCRLPNKIWYRYEEDRIAASRESIKRVDELARQKEKKSKD